MKFYRGLIFVNILFACITIFEIIGYAWLMHHHLCLSPILDGLLVVVSFVDIAWCISLTQHRIA